MRRRIWTILLPVIVVCGILGLGAWQSGIDGGISAARIFGVLTPGDCIQAYSVNSISDAGSACGSGGGGDTITSPNSTLTVGGTSAATTLDLALGHSNTWTGNTTISTAATNSNSPLLLTGAPNTGGTGTTNFPNLYLSQGATAVTTFSTGGVEMGVNAPSGYTGDFFEFYINNAQKSKMSSSGALYVPQIYSFATGSVEINLPSTGVVISHNIAGDVPLQVGNLVTTPTVDLFEVGFGTSFTKKAWFDATANLNAPSVIPSVIYSAAGTALPSCASGIKGEQAVVSDATSPTYMAAYTSGGGITAAVICSYNGTTYSWLTH